jgi:alcohol dehydrogenase class IV
MQNVFTFNLETTTFFGAHAHKKLPEIIQNNSWRQLALIIDKGVVDTAVARELLEELKRQAEIFVFEARSTEEPDYEYLENCRIQFEDRLFDCMIGIGGGSTLDLSKAIAVLINNCAKAIEYRGFDLVKNPGIPMIAIPTTAGTGSEITPYAVFIDKKERRKMGINGRYVRAKFAILDPVFTLSCPHRVTVSSGMDALTHTLESYVAKNATPISQIFAREAFRLIFNSLPKVIKDPANIELRFQMLLGSFYAAISLMNSGAGPAGALSYPLGVYFKVPHGLAGGFFLSHIAEYNVKGGYEGYCQIYDDIEGVGIGLSLQEKCQDFVHRLFMLTEEIGVPKTLNEFGVAKKDIDFLADKTVEHLRPALEQNPVIFERNNILELLHRLTI